MRKILFLVVGLLIVSNLYSQNKKIFYDDKWMVCDSINAKYYRIVENYYNRSDKYKFVDHYITGEIQMEGYSTDRDILKYNGEFKWYYKNGNISKQSTWSKNKERGLIKKFYASGQMMCLSKQDRRGIKIIQSWDSTGIQIADHGRGKCYLSDLSGNEFECFEIKKGKKDGLSTGYIKKSKVRFEEYYEKGKLKNGISYDSLQNKYEYDKIGKLASFQDGGIKEFMQFISLNVKYPPNLLKMGVEGRVICQFFILPDGKVSKVKIIRSSGYKEFDNEASNVINTSPDWAPGINRGMKVEQSFFIPIAFRLQMFSTKKSMYL